MTNDHRDQWDKWRENAAAGKFPYNDSIGQEDSLFDSMAATLTRSKDDGTLFDAGGGDALGDLMSGLLSVDANIKEGMSPFNSRR